MFEITARWFLFLQKKILIINQTLYFLYDNKKAYIAFLKKMIRNDTHDIIRMV